MIWQRYIGEITDEPVDVAELVSASDLFTPGRRRVVGAHRRPAGVRAGALRRRRPARDDGGLPRRDPERQADADAGDDRRVPRRDRAVQARLTDGGGSACFPGRHDSPVRAIDPSPPAADDCRMPLPVYTGHFGPAKPKGFSGAPDSGPGRARSDRSPHAASTAPSRTCSRPDRTTSSGSRRRSTVAVCSRSTSSGTTTSGGSIGWCARADR